MKVALSWLKEWITLSCPEDQLPERLTMAGIEVEGIERRGADFPHVVVCEILESRPHPSADRLSVCQVSTGDAKHQIVCGAKNYQVGDRVPLALPGAVLPGDFKIKKSKLRGETSEGMMCSGRELALSSDQDGLLILDRTAPLGAPLSQIFPADTVYDLEITPNRPDLLSYVGLARDLVAMGAAEWREMPDMSAAACETSGAFQVQCLSPVECPCYTATLLENVRVGPSPAWLAQKLELAGLRPINNLVDITNFVLLEMGQPMHVFDLDTFAAPDRVIIRFAQPGERLRSLDKQDLELDAKDLVIADAERPVALAGVIGGEPSGVTSQTARVLLEVARFRPGTVRLTSRRLGIHTDSSYRFERGIDPAGVVRARRRALELIERLAGGETVATAVAGSLESPRRTVPLRPARVQRLVGCEIPPDQIDRALGRLGCEPAPSDSAAALQLWTIPSWRPDLEREVDLIEEVVRLVGIEPVPSRLRVTPAPETAVDRGYKHLVRIKNILASMGYSEVLTSPLDSDPEQPVKLINPMGDQVALRSELRRQMLRVAAHNLNQGQRSLRLFQIGRVFQEDGQQTRLALLVGGTRHEPHWSSASQDLDVFDLKGTLSALDLDPQSAALVPMPDLKAAGIKIAIGYAELPVPSELQRPSYRLFQEWPVYPAVERDMAFLVPRDLPFQTVENAIRDFKSALLEGASLFDIFIDDSGVKLSPDKKSLAVNVRYRSQDRTLTDQEVNDEHNRLKQSLLSAIGCEFR